MFIWFVYQDDPGQPWESGLYTQTGLGKGPAPSRFASAARPLDARHPVVSRRLGTRPPLVTLHGRRFCVVDGVGERIGITWRTRIAGRLVDVGQAGVALQSNCTVDVRLTGLRIARRASYVTTFELNDINGETLTRRVTIRGS